MKYLVAALMILPVAMLASTVPCNVGIADVTTLQGGNSCVLGDQTFSDFSVLFSPEYNAVNIGILSTSDVEHEAAGDYVNLAFGVTTDPAVQTVQGTWIRLTYRVDSTVPLTGIKLDNVDGDGYILYEDACDAKIEGNACTGNLLAHQTGFPGAAVSTQLSSQVDSMYLQKYFAGNDATITLVNNGVQEAPEPVSFGLMGAGLILVSMIGRKYASK